MELALTIAEQSSRKQPTPWFTSTKKIDQGREAFLQQEDLP